MKIIKTINTIMLIDSKEFSTLSIKEKDKILCIPLPGARA